MKKFFLLAFLPLACGVNFFLAQDPSLQMLITKRIRANSPPAWALAQLKEDFAPFQSKKITREMLDEMMQKDAAQKGAAFLVRYQIKNNRVSMSCYDNAHPHGHMEDVRKALELLTQCTTLPDLDFVLCVGDGPTIRDLPAPLFAFAKNCSDNGVVLIPDYEALTKAEFFLSHIKEGGKKYPWKQKFPKAVWRGATSGAVVNGENFLALPRSQVVAQSLRLPHLIDARYNHLCQCENPEEIRNKYPQFFGKLMKIYKHLQYKYQILVDGNTCAYSRAYWQLFSNCLIFKHTSPNVQWFYKGLEPNVHYIPLRADCSDLAEKIEWAIQHDEEAQKISQNAHHFAKKNLMPEDIYYYLYLALTEYAKF